ncbi:hypothetical protein PFISCL1PPCAC_8532, partial [Pristionchus fissidentatus]
LLEGGERPDESVAEVAHFRLVLRLGRHVVNKQLVDGQILFERLDRSPSIRANLHQQLVQRRRVEGIESSNGRVEHHELSRLAAARVAHHHRETLLVLEESGEDRGMVELGELLSVTMHRLGPLEALHEAHNDGVGAAL